MIIALIDEAVSAGARLAKAAQTVNLCARTIIRWRKANDDRRNGPKQSPANKLGEKDRRRILEVANSPAYRDLSPKQIVPKLADQGIYIGSESSFYRILRQQQMINHRQATKPATGHRPDAHVADGPCRVFSWDITYLRSVLRGQFYYLYMIVDVWSRKIMAAAVFEQESMDLAVQLFAHICKKINDSPFFCEADARKAADHLSKAAAGSYHRLQCRIGKVDKYPRGRPSASIPRTPIGHEYILEVMIEEDQAALATLRLEAGCFVLLSNLTDPKEYDLWSAKALLTLYKDQGGIEQNFSFLKDPVIVNSIFLKRHNGSKRLA